MTIKRVAMGIFLITFFFLSISPQVAQSKKIRNFMLVFDVADYSAQIKETVSYFIKNIIQKGDQLIVITPRRLIGFSPDKLNAPKNKLISDLSKTLKADINTGMASYREAFEEMKRVILGFTQRAGGTPGPAKVLLADYTKNRQILDTIRRGKLEERLLKYSKIFRPTKGTQFENHLVMILEKSIRPIPDRDTMDDFRNYYRDYGFDIQEAFLEERIDNQSDINFKKIEAAFKYANTRFHLMYLQSKKLRSHQGIEYVENSGQIYKAFSNVVESTGGIKLSTATPSAFFKNVEQLLEGKVEVEVIDESVKNE